MATATGANTRSVAEYVVTSALVLLRRAFRANSTMTSGAWPRAVWLGHEIAGRVLGLIGFDTIARKTAELAAGLSMTIVAHDPLLLADNAVWKDTKRMELDDVLGIADIISLHVPLNSKTRHMIGARELARMKPGAVLVNTARGGIVDEAALVASMRSGHLGGVAFVVFETEPLTAEAAAIFDGRSNLVHMQHIAGVAADSNVRVSRMIGDIVLDRLGKTQGDHTAKKIDRRIISDMLQSGTDFASFVPCKQLAGALPVVDLTPAILHVPCTKEDEGMGLRAGVFLGGMNPAIVMHNTALGVVMNTLATLIQFHTATTRSRNRKQSSGLTYWSSTGSKPLSTRVSMKRPSMRNARPRD